MKGRNEHTKLRYENAVRSSEKICKKENTGRYKERMQKEDARANKRKKGEKISRGKRKM